VRGNAGKARRGVTRPGYARQGKATQAWPGMAGMGAAWLGLARPGAALHKPGSATGVKIALTFLQRTTNQTHTND